LKGLNWGGCIRAEIIAISFGEFRNENACDENYWLFSGKTDGIIKNKRYDLCFQR